MEADPPRVIDQIVVGDGPEGLAMSPAGGYAASVILNGTGGTPKTAFYRHEHSYVSLPKIEGKTVRNVGQLDVGGLAEGAAFSPDGRYPLRGKFCRRQHRHPAAQRRHAYDGRELCAARASGLDAREHALSQSALKREEVRHSETQRVAIVTGAAGGIGKAMTHGLLAAGIRVAGVDRDREPLEALAASAGEQGKRDDFLTIQTDLSNDSAADEITRATRTRFDRIDILVNNAGIGPGSIRPDSWQRPLKFWEITPDQ
jgi:short chain dehydrogenase